jgi:two-component system sensor histidine kinase EvgS
MFKRLHNRAEYDGSGIGLAIVKLSVDKLGGTVELESEEGKGSRFVIQLPI